VTERVEVPSQGEREVSPWLAIGIFLLLTICLTGIFWGLVIATQTVTAMYIFGGMWMPAVSALLTCRILRRPIGTLGLGTWSWRYVLIGYLIPIVYCLVASLGTWVFGFGGFPNTEFVGTTAETLGLTGTPDWIVIVVFVLLQGTVGMVTGVAVATGEEIGWRGFLVPELAKVLPFTGVALVSGLIWASWHYSITPIVYRDADLPAWFWLLTFTFVAVAISFAQTWLRLKSNSVWPPVFLHASHNLWMQSIFFPLTTENETTKWVAGDLGLAFVVVAAVVAVVFWAKRGDVRIPVDNVSADTR
jgi:membrane protease YdiL (CAAX protease family)